MATVTKGYTFGATEQVTATKLHNLVDLGSVTNIGASDLSSNILSSLPTTAGQLKYYNIVSSLASGSLIRYDGSSSFVGTSVLSSTPSVSGNQYWSPRFLATLSVNWNNGNVQYLSLVSGSQSVSLSNPQDGGRYALILKQPSGGFGNISMPTIVLWPNATMTILTTTANKVDIITMIYDNVNGRYYGGSSLNY